MMILLIEHIFNADDPASSPQKIVAVYGSREKLVSDLRIAGYTELDLWGQFHHEDPRRLFVDESIFYSLREDLPFNKYDFLHRYG